MVSRQLPHIYTPDAGDAPGMQAGFVLNPTTLLSVLRCAWAVDVSNGLALPSNCGLRLDASRDLPPHLLHL